LKAIQERAKLVALKLAFPTPLPMTDLSLLLAPAFAALSMGLLGGPHCIAMCSAACAGVARASTGVDQPSNKRLNLALLQFQLGRVVGYAVLGAVAAGSVQAMGWLGANTTIIRPLWMSFHVAAALLGLTLLMLGRQPYWIDGFAQRVWRVVRQRMGGVGSNAPALVGVAWALMPCGLLYAALILAALQSSAWHGGLTMAIFAFGSGVSMTFGAWWLLRMNLRPSGPWAMRAAGLALMSLSLWAIYMGLTSPTGLWCA